MNPYNMWREQSPRQVLELLTSYKDMNEDSKEEKKNYTVKSKKKVKIPDWYTVPEGANVYHVDDVCQGDM